MSPADPSPETSPPAETGGASGLTTRGVELIKRARSALALVIMFVAASQISEFFLLPGNLVQVISQNSIIGILAIGMTFVILSGGIDLSVGSMMLCAGVITAGLLRAGNVEPILALLACLSIGSLLGLVNGFLVAGLRIPPFIATLAMMVGAISIGQLYSGGSPIIVGEVRMPALIGGFDAFLWREHGGFPGVPVAGLVFALAAVGGHIVLSRTRYGRYIYALGGNREALRLSGVNTRVLEGSVYVVSGFLAGLAALIYTARLQSGQALYGQNYELDAIAAVVIGGASLFGGIGTAGGTVMGVLFVGILINVMQLQNVNPYLQGGIRALAIVMGVLIQTRWKK